MKRALLVARSEFLKYVTRRGFIISLVMFPLWVVIGGVVPQWIESKTPTRNFTVVDRTGGHYAFAVAEAAREDAQTAERDALSAYAQANLDMARLRQRLPRIAAILDAPSEDPETLAQFRKLGGARGVLLLAGAFRKTDNKFVSPRPRFRFQPPENLARTGADTFALAVNAQLSGSSDLYAVVLIPKGFSAAKNSPEAEFWSVNASDPELEHFVRRALTEELRRQTLARYAPDVPPRILKPNAKLRAFDPAASGGDHELSLADQARTWDGLPTITVLSWDSSVSSFCRACIQARRYPNLDSPRGER
jgi:ABC-2 type transport system permease protein